MTAEQRKKTEPTPQDKLRQIYQEAERFLEGDRERYFPEVEVTSAVRRLLYHVAGRVERASEISEDFKRLRGSFGMESGVTIENIEVSSLSNFAFKRFPFSELIDKGILSLDDKISCVMTSKVINLTTKNGNVTARIDALSPLILASEVVGEELIEIELLEGQDPLERTLAIVEFLQAIDREADNKLKAPANS